MHFTLLVAGALVPGELAAALTASLDAPHLKARLSRATVALRSGLSGTDTAHLDWLAKHLFGRSDSAATGPYAYAQLAGQPAMSFISHADLVHIDIARDHLILQPLANNAPSVAESEQLIAVANELAISSGCEFVMVDGHWFLLSAGDWHIETRPLTAVATRAVELPTGRDASRWNHLHNKVQMAWHAHPVNVEREARGVPTINAIWLHGGGRWQPLAPIKFAQVHADASGWQGAADAAGAHGVPADAPVADSALVIFDEPWECKQREDWSAWMRAMGAVDHMLIDRTQSVDLVLCGNSTRTFELRLSDRYKVWRRRTLAEALTQ